MDATACLSASQTSSLLLCLLFHHDLQALSLARQWAPLLAAKAAEGGAAAASGAAGAAASAAAAAAPSGISAGGAAFVLWAVLVLMAGAVICKTISQSVEQRG